MELKKVNADALGLDVDLIKTGGIRNFIQLVVVDTDSETKNITHLVEARRPDADEEAAVLAVQYIPFGKNYAFLILVGYWEHDGNYNYVSGKPPTLLAAGLKEQDVTQSGTITVTMWPIVADTVFTTTDGDVPSNARTAVSTVGDDGKPGTVDLFPVDWNITWTVKGGIIREGFIDLLVGSQLLN